MADDLEEETPRASWFDTQQLVAYIIVGSTIIIILIWLFRPPTGSEGAMAVLNNLMGALLAAFGMVVNYFFGSSKGSKDKDEAQTKIMEKITGTGPGNNQPAKVITTTPADPGTTATITTVTTDDPKQPPRKD